MSQLMPLAMCEPGIEVEVEMDTFSNYLLRKRLTDLGIYNGSRLKIVQNDFRGPIIVKAKDSNIALGRGQASKIMVKKIV